MRFILPLVFLLGGSNVEALHIQTSNGTENTAQEDKRIPTVLVMFDQKWMTLFDCWARYYNQNLSKKLTHLDVVVFDETAADHTRKYLKETYPNILRRLQVVAPPSNLLQSNKSNTSTGWPSTPYQAFYWQLIQERLQKGEDVWHFDIDTLLVGDAWTPVLNYLPDVDIVAPGVPGDIQQESVYYKNTEAVKTIVDHFAGIWKDWLKNATTTSKTPLPAERLAIKAYIKENNPEGCNQTAHWRDCKTHKGTHFNWGHQLPSFRHNGLCRPFDGCEELNIAAAHGHGILNNFCTPEEYGDIFQDLPQIPPTIGVDAGWGG